MRKYFWWCGLCLLAGCSASHPVAKSLPARGSLSVTASTLSNPSPFVPFVSPANKSTALAVKKLVQRTDSDLAETRSAINHLQEERTAPSVVSPGPDILEPGLAVPMPKVRVTDTR